MIELSVVVTTHNRLHYLKRQLHCFSQQTDDRFEVIIADDGSTDGTEKWCNKAIKDNIFNFRLKYIKQEYQGFRLAAVRNLGTKVASGTRVLFTDNDCWHCTNSVSAHTMTQANQIAVGHIYWINKKYSEKMLSNSQFVPTDQQLKDCSEKERRTFSRKPPAVNVWGGNFSINKELLFQCGGHDERFNGYGGEEIDLALRLTSKYHNAKLAVVPKSIAFHIWHNRGKVHKAKSGQNLLSKRRQQNYYRQNRKGSLIG